MELTASDEKVQLVPGVEGPRWLTYDRGGTWSREGGGIAVSLQLEYDEALGRYVCTEYRAYRSPDASEGHGFVTSEALRHESSLAAFTWAALNIPQPVARELPNPDNVEPWGWTPPEGLGKEGPTDRTLRWAAHLYRYGMAVHMNPGKVVEETLKLSHSTAARWVRIARQKGYLGPAEGPGRAAG